jgi:oligopeptide/dipeptide ABC transporter ATP-binding protein
MSIMRLIDRPGRILGGKIFFEGRNLLELDESQMINVRGKEISMIFQQPQSALNPVFNVGSQIVEVMHTHQENFNKGAAWKAAVDLLSLVGIPDAEKKSKAYPHEMSGGQAQRIMIAMALALNPKILIADEPTTALDVTIQAQILDLMRGLQKNMGTSVILITHDLGIVAELADRVAVMYAGRVVEQTDVRTLFANNMHPYTMGLIASVPVLGETKERLETIPGNVPNLVNLPPGCRFASRCMARVEHGLQICEQIEPDLLPIKDGHLVRCWLYQNLEEHKAPLHETSA